MNVTLNPTARQISALHNAHFAEPKAEQTEKKLTPNRDQVSFSQEGQQAAADSMKRFAEKMTSQIDAMTKDDLMKQLKQWQAEHKLEIDPYRAVDPDGAIATKTYFESYIGQLMEEETTIKQYYAGAYEEAVSAPINSLTFISGKYLCDWSDYFDPSMPTKERQWTHRQLWAMLTDTHVALNDPYALAATGGPKTVDQMDKIARQAVKDKLDALIKERESTD